MADVDELADELQIRRGQQVLVDELLPDLAALLARLGVAVARQVDEVEVLAALFFAGLLVAQLGRQLEEVDRLRLARLRGDAREAAYARQRVDEG